MIKKVVLFCLYNIINGYYINNRPILKNNIKMISPSELLDVSLKSNNLDLWTYNDLNSHLKNIETVAIAIQQKTALFYDGSYHAYRFIPTQIDMLTNSLIKNNIDFQIFDFEKTNQFEIPIFIQVIFGYLFISYILSFITSRFLGGPGGMNPLSSMNKDVNMVVEGQITTRFEDVAGLDEAKEELEEVVDYLKSPFKYGAAGAKIPNGVLLEGPPGTGKTLLARAVAGEAGVPFISASGSEFIEMFVGVGAQRVRKLFEKAAENKPAVIFIDEIDAVGGRRGYGFNSGGNDEREQTLNQILTNMDGFDKSDGIIVLAATNRADTLDPALKRSGRFDRKININLPDFYGRKAIANVHFKNKPNVKIDYNNLATLTSGFSGADIETLANEAALLSVRFNKTVIDNSLLLKAFEKMKIGLPKKYESRSNDVLDLVANHEIGHALMVDYFKEFFTLQKVTLNANTAGAGGYTLFTPKEQYSEYPTKGYYLAQMIVSLGGRAAEIIFYKNNTLTYDILKDYDDLDITTGASQDLKQCSSLAKNYISLFESYIPEDITDINKALVEDRVAQLIYSSLESAISIIENDYKRFNKLVKKLKKEKIISF